MKTYPIKRTNGGPMQWEAPGENAAEALDNWEHCFGPGFELVDEAKGELAR